MKIPLILREFGKIFSKAGFECYLVGGAVRNMAAEIPASDYDFATDALPEEVTALFRRVIPTGIKHGTVTVMFKHHQFEVTTFRVDGLYSDLRRPDSVAYTPSVFEDLKRRDFTINSMALNLSTRVLLDPHNGIADLKAGIIRAIGDPAVRFSEDALRILRGCRFAAQLGFKVEESTILAMKKLKENLSLVSAERIRDEFIKILAADKPSIAFRLMDDVGILPILFPELEELKSVAKRTDGAIDVLDHSLTACDLALNDLVVRLAVLLHDLGKARAYTESADKGIHFHEHEKISAELAEALLDRLKFPRHIQKTVGHLVRHHMFYYDDSITDSALRRLVSKVGKIYVYSLLQLRFADTKAASGMAHVSPRNRNLQRRIDRIITETEALAIKDLKVNGYELAEKAGIPKGPAMGTVLTMLLEAVLDDPSMNEKESLLNLAKNFYNEYMNPGKD